MIQIVSLPFAAAVAEFVIHVCRHRGRGARCLRRGVVHSSSHWDATVARLIDKHKKWNVDHMVNRRVVCVPPATQTTSLINERAFFRRRITIGQRKTCRMYEVLNRTLVRQVVIVRGQSINFKYVCSMLRDGFDFGLLRERSSN